VLQIALGIVAVIAGLYDLRYRRVPNWLVLGGLAAGLGLNTWVNGFGGLGTSLKGAGLALLVYLPLYLIRAMGAGDVKLMAAIGSIVGPANWFGVFIVTGILGGVVGLTAVVLKGRLNRTARNLWLIGNSLRMGVAPYQTSPELDVRSDQAFRLPHATVIMFGTAIFLWIAAVYAPR